MLIPFLTWLSHRHGFPPPFLPPPIPYSPRHSLSSATDHSVNDHPAIQCTNEMGITAHLRLFSRFGLVF
jgi:hypothetical protein